MGKSVTVGYERGWRELVRDVWDEFNRGKDCSYLGREHSLVASLALYHRRKIAQRSPVRKARQLLTFSVLLKSGDFV